MEISEHKYLNALNLALGADFLTLYRLKERFESYESIWNLKSSDAENIPDLHKSKERILKAKDTINPDEEWQKLKNQNIDFLLKEDDHYPKLLKEIPHAPLGLYVKGIINPDSIKISVVGTRRPSYYGKQAAEQITGELSKAQIDVVSGLAWGTDTIVHKTALKYGAKTLAVLGCGIDIIYPPVNKKLAQEIIKNGALISEYPLGTPPVKYHFPLRNRIISGLSLGVIVTEAPLKSGALITAKYALDQNREVFSVPGPITSNLSIGTNRLIQQGAKLILSARDVFEELNLDLNLDTKEKMIELEDKQEEEIMAYFLDSEPILIDKIIEQSNLEASEVLSTITSLELKGLIKNIGGGNYIKTTPAYK